jgi:hypothetical protein
MDHDMSTCPCYKDAITLIDVRADTNRIRMQVQQLLTHVSECASVLDSVNDLTSWGNAIKEQLALASRMLDRLPRN